MTKDAAELIEKAKESVAAAELLFSQGYNDFAVSRAYYAMFYVAEACLSSIGQSFSSHSAVHSAFGREFAKPGKLDPKFHRWLLDAQDMRNVGDYGIGVEMSEEQARTVCEWAREFIAAVEQFLK